jgi:hypothetical protein
MDNKTDPNELKSLMITAWQNKAAKKLIAQYIDGLA